MKEDNKKMAEALVDSEKNKLVEDENKRELTRKLFELEMTLEKNNLRQDKVLDEKARLVKDFEEQEKRTQAMRVEVYETRKKMESVMSELNKYIEDLKREQKGLRNTNNHLKEELKDKKNYIEDLEEELNKKNKNPKSASFDTELRLDLEVKNQELGLGRERADQLEQMVENLKRELGKLRRDEDKSRQKEEDQENKAKELERDLRGKDRHSIEMRNQIENLNAEIIYQEEAEDEKETVKQAGINTTIDEGRKEVIDLTEKVKALTEENRDLMNDLENMRYEREDWKEKGADLEHEVRLKTKEVDILKEERLQGGDDLEQLKNLLLQKNRDLDKYRGDEDHLRLEMIKIGDENLKFQAEKMMAEKERDHARKLAEDDRLYLKEDLDKKNKVIGQLRDRVKDLDMETEESNFKLYGIEKKLRLVEEVNMKNVSDIEIKDSKIEDLKSQLKYLKEQLGSMDTQETNTRYFLE